MVFFVKISCHTTLIYLPLKFFTITYLQTTFFIKLGKPWWGPLMWIFEIVLWWFTVFRNMKWLCCAILHNTVWKLKNSSAIQILRETDFAFWRLLTKPKITSLSKWQVIEKFLNFHTVYYCRLPIICMVWQPLCEKINGRLLYTMHF